MYCVFEKSQKTDFDFATQKNSGCEGKSYINQLICVHISGHHVAHQEHIQSLLVDLKCNKIIRLSSYTLTF